MKYKVGTWGPANKPGLAWVSVLPAHLDPPHLDNSEQICLFPVGHDPVREEQARMLAKKVCAFLNELEEKKAQIVELMTIAGSKE